MQLCLQFDMPNVWDEVVDRALRDWKGKSLQATICRLALGSVVYNIWMFN